jgi:hypothetical protein
MKKISKIKENALKVKKIRARKQSRLSMLDDDDIPVVKNPTVTGFWGNNTTGHHD